MPNTSITAKIVEWDDQKGFGFLQAGNQSVFLHRNDFSERRKRPAVGDVIRFTLGQDAKGRICARNAAHVNDAGRVTILTFLILAGMLILPVSALYRREINLLWAGGYFLVVGLLSYGSYALDKQRARTQAWRIPESTLHLMELLGGWPFAFLAQRRLRHKVSKVSYQVGFWLIVLTYQFVAYDSLQNWQLTQAGLHRFQRLENRPKATQHFPAVLIITNRTVR